MKALVYEQAHALDHFAIEVRNVAEPEVRDTDLLVDVRAIGVNPGEAFLRSVRSAERGGHVLLGWEFAGVVVAVGSAAPGFAVGDRVFGTGDMARAGCWAERVAVDHRIVAKLPDELSFGDGASLPVGAITAWEAVFRDQLALPRGVERVLVVGGAGAVGSVATQLLKARTEALVIATASRPASRAWCREMGADLVIDHAGDVGKQLADADLAPVDLVLSTAGSAAGVDWIAAALRPFGHLSVVDMSTSLALGPLMAKSISVHTEMIFSRIMHGGDVRRQREILETVAQLVTQGRLRSITTTRLEGLLPATMRAAHELVESRRTIGKVVIAT